MAKIVVGVMGASPFAMTSGLATTAQVKSLLDVCRRYEVKELDTARVYGQGRSEEMLGELNASNDFLIGTKILTGPKLTRDAVLQSAEASLKALKVSQVDLFYIHRPDRETPLEETVAAVGELGKRGMFKRFGVSNYRADEVQQIHDICKKNDFILPSVYQGNFNPLARNAENGLFPTLRRLGIEFYGFGPTASGMFAKQIEDLENAATGKESRWSVIPLPKMFYGKPEMFQEVRNLQSVCKQHSLTTLQGALRWLRHHSALQEEDAIILGGSSVEQMQQNLEAANGGSLPLEVAQAFEEVWPRIASLAGPYHA